MVPNAILWAKNLRVCARQLMALAALLEETHRVTTGQPFKENLEGNPTPAMPCPECGAMLFIQEGCIHCPGCGYEKC